jgi:predicted ATP-dependent serine protease
VGKIFGPTARAGADAMTTKATIKRLAAGVPGLDEVLGGGLPEFSFNLIAGEPGCGKTTLARIVAEVPSCGPGLVFVDSFRSVVMASGQAGNGHNSCSTSCSNSAC